MPSTSIPDATKAELFAATPAPPISIARWRRKSPSLSGRAETFLDYRREPPAAKAPAKSDAQRRESKAEPERATFERRPSKDEPALSTFEHSWTKAERPAAKVDPRGQRPNFVGRRRPRASEGGVPPDFPRRGQSMGEQGIASVERARQKRPRGWQSSN